MVYSTATPSGHPSAAPPKASVFRQILVTPWLLCMLILSGLFLTGMMWLSVHSERGFLTMWDMDREFELLARDIAAIELVNVGLGHEIMRLRHDLGYIEKIAREELGLVRPGEIVFEFAK